MRCSRASSWPTSTTTTPTGCPVASSMRVAIVRALAMDPAPAAGRGDQRARPELIGEVLTFVRELAARGHDDDFRHARDGLARDIADRSSSLTRGSCSRRVRWTASSATRPSRGRANFCSESSRPGVSDDVPFGRCGNGVDNRPMTFGIRGQTPLAGSAAARILIPVPEESVDPEIASKGFVVPSGRFCVRRTPHRVRPR